MKKIFKYLMVLGLIGVMASCQKSEDKAVLEFGLNFGEMVVNKDKQGVKRVYPDLGDYSDAHLTFSRDQVDVFPEENGLYKVRYSDGSYIIVKPGLNGAMEVVDSKGIFETGDNSVEKEKKNEPSKEEKAEAKPEKKEKEAAPLINNSPYPIAPGSHTLSGKAEGKYPIVVYLNVSSSGSVSGKMAYKSTLKKYGNSSSSYMYINGYFSGNDLILDLDGIEEWSLRVSDNGTNYKLNGTAYNHNLGKSFSVNVSGK